MILTDYFYPEYSSQWDVSAACGIKKATVRLPETPDFDYTDRNSVHAAIENFRSHGFTPIILEPIPNALHEHIKLGDEKRDECIEKFISLLSILAEEGVNTVCFNFMAHYGWTRTGEYPSRAGSIVTGFEIDDKANTYYDFRDVRPFALPFRAAKTAALSARTKRIKDTSPAMTERRFS